MKEGEWELADLLGFLIKRKRFILLGTLISFLTLSVIIYLMRAPEVYGTDCVLKIGMVAGDSLEKTSTISEYLKTDEIHNEIARALKIPPPAFENAGIVVDVDSEAETDPFLIITAEAPKAELAIAVAQSTAEALVRKHKVLFDEQFRERLEYEKSILTHIQEVERNKKYLEDLAGKTILNSDTAALAFLVIQGQVQERQARLLDLLKELRDIRIENYSETNTSQTRIVNSAGPAKKIAPGGLLRYVLFAGLASLLLFTFLAIVLEAWQKARMERAALQV